MVINSVVIGWAEKEILSSLLQLQATPEPHLRSPGGELVTAAEVCLATPPVPPLKEPVTEWVCLAKSQVKRLFGIKLLVGVL